MNTINNKHSLKCSFILAVLCAFTLSVTLSACSFAPEYEQPQLDLPEVWLNPADGSEYDESEAISVQWWKRFNDPALDTFIEKALTHNYDLLIVAEQVNQARAYLGIAQADLFPTLAGTGSASNAMQSMQAYKDYPANLMPDRKYQYYSLGLQAVWELDFWGKYRNGTAAAREQLLASEYGQQALRLSIASQTAHAYFSLLALDAQLEVSRRTLASREEALNIYKDRYEQGLINELDYLRSSIEVDTVRTNLYTLEYQIDNAETALQILMGQSPREIIEAEIERSAKLIDLPTLPQLPTGIPSDLLQRRPDILAAEANLRASNYNVGVAKSAWFPSISLTGALGFQSYELGDLFDEMSGLWSYGASVSMPLFNAGKISDNIDASEAAVRVAVLKYQQTVQNAFKDVKTALAVQESIGNVVKTLEHTVESLEKTAALAQLRYDNGYESYIEVLDAERSLFSAEIQLVQARASHLSTIVNICLSLGGGWNVKEFTSSID